MNSFYILSLACSIFAMGQTYSRVFSNSLQIILSISISLPKKLMEICSSSIPNSVEESESGGGEPINMFLGGVYLELLFLLSLYFLRL